MSESNSSSPTPIVTESMTSSHSTSHSHPKPLGTVVSGSVGGGGVGAGLATQPWWDQYYRQQHDTYWDWYLENETVKKIIVTEAKKRFEGKHQRTQQMHASELSTTDQERDETDPIADFSSSSPIPSTLSLLSSLSVLQLGCGNSEITFLLRDVGMHHLANIDFSPECIERMNQLINEKRNKEEQMRSASDDTHVATASLSPSTSPSLSSSSSSSSSSLHPSDMHTFTFAVMDVRCLSYSPSLFDLVFDKGTLDCVVLESTDGITAGHDMIRESHRVLQSGGVSICFSLYPPAARAKFWINVIPNQHESETSHQREEDDFIRSDLCELVEMDNPPHVLTTIPAWSEFRMIALDQSPLELPNQAHTYVYIATKR